MMAVAAPPRPTTIEHRLPRSAPALRARPIPVAAYPAGVPRWVTFEGRRQRVLTVHEQPAFDTITTPLVGAARRVRVELAGGRALTLVQESGAWFER